MKNRTKKNRPKYNKTNYSQSKKKQKKQRRNPLPFLLIPVLVLVLVLGARFLITRLSDRGGQGKTDQTASEVSTDEQPEEKMSVHFIDVDQGDATLILSDGHAMLIDAGGNAKGTAVQKYLMDREVSSLDYAVCTHPDEDHIGGMDVILTKFDCGQVIMPDVESDNASYPYLMDVIEDKMIRTMDPVPGTTFDLGQAKCTILAPAGEYEDTDLNNWSVCLRLDCGDSSFLFTGDAEEAAEQDMLAGDRELGATVLKLGHHGSSSSSSPDFLDAVSPTFAVISCGKDNDYGHPAEKTLEELKSRDIKVFRTDLQGSIIATTDGEQITWDKEPDQSWQPGVYKGPWGNHDSESEEGTTEEVRKIDDSETDSDAAGDRSATDSYDYILNTNTMKFHFPDCPSVGDMAVHNKEGSNLSRDELIEEGYSPCGRCNP